ncbi:MAG: serine/threonine protein kinase [Myxococcales bacterium]|nr:serine/threonine protein kinase [Myxococcales bacterium]
MNEEADASPSEEFLKEVARAPAVEPPAPETDLVGHSVGRYHVLSRLGQGGMGIVYRARDSVLGREVALKVLPQDVMRDAGRRRRFLKEARLAAAINHPNLVAIYDVGEADERIYLAMELVNGQPLRDKLAEGPMEIGEVLRIGADMARGIARAHTAGIVHRDLKPENVMVASDGTVKIPDFGIATIRATGADGTTPTDSGGSESDLGLVVGTPSYMSPEQAKLREITDKSDCFALGVVLYEMVTGRRPFTGTTAFEIVIAIDRDAPEAIEVARPGTPRGLADIVMRCLEKQPQGRPTADAVARALGELAVSGGGAGDVTIPSSSVRAPKARYLWAAAIVALGLVAVLALASDPAPSAVQEATNVRAGRVPSAASAAAPDPLVAASSARLAPSVSVSASASSSPSASASASAARAGASRTLAPGASPPEASAPAVPSVAPAVSASRDPLADPI